MKLVIDKSDFLNELATVYKAVRAKTTLPILECVCIKSDGTTLTIEATNMEFAIRSKMPCIGERGAVCIEAKQLVDILKKMPDSDISIEVNEKYEINLTAGKKIKFKLSGRDPENFPVILEEDGEVITINGTTLKEAVNGVSFCAAKESTNNKMMSGINVKITGNQVRFCALDGHRIGIRNITLPTPSPKDYDINIPEEYLSEIVKVLPGEDVELTINERNMMIKSQDTIITTRLIEGTYFNIQQMLTNTSSTLIEVNRNELTSAVDRSILVICSESKKPVIMNIEEGQPLHLHGNSTIGKIEEDIEIISMTGSHMKIGFNPRFLLDMLRVIPDDIIKISFINAKAPASVKADDESYNYVVLPVNFVEVEG